jgi:SRSO17 transposase
VFLVSATSKGRTLIDRELYLPKPWIADRDRCRAAAIPGKVEFATMTVLAQQMLDRALDAGVPAAWITTGEAYGQDSKFRTWCERSGTERCSTWPEAPRPPSTRSTYCPGRRAGAPRRPSQRASSRTGATRPASVRNYAQRSVVTTAPTRGNRSTTVT